MSVPWRNSIPHAHIFGSLSGQPQDNVYRFQPEVGKHITQPMTSGTLEAMSFVVPMTLNQYQEFKDMWATDLKFGSMNFTLQHPQDGTTKTFSFVEPYTWAQITPNKYHVGMSLLEEPSE